MRRTQSGYILIQAIVVLAGLLSLVAILVADERASNDKIQMRLDQRRADEAADAAVQRAMCVLAGPNTNTNIVMLSDDWALQGTGGDDQFTFQNSNATYRMQIVDAGSLLNMNVAAGASSVTPAIPGVSATSSPILQLMPLQQDQIDSLLDWVGNPTAQALSDGAKNAFYNALPLPANGLPEPYDTPIGVAPNGTTTEGLTTVNELLLVNNWTAQTLYQPANTTSESTGSGSTGTANGPPGSTSSAVLPTDTNGDVMPLASLLTVDSGSPNTQASGNPRVSVAAALAQNGIGRPTAAERNSTSFQALFNAAPSLRSTTAETNLLNTVSFLPTTTAASTTTASGATTPQRIVGRINLNTAQQAVLQMIPGLPTSVMSTIVTQQSTGFQTLGQLVSASGLTPAQVANVADYFTIGSDTWIVRAYGACGNATTALEVVVRITDASGQGETAQVINWERLNTTGIPIWWDWDLQPNSTIDAGVAE